MNAIGPNSIKCSFSPLLSNVTDRHDKHPRTQTKKNESKWPRHGQKNREKSKGRVNLRHGVAVVEDDHSSVVADNVVQLLLGLALDDDRSDLRIACHGVRETLGVCCVCQLL